MSATAPPTSSETTARPASSGQAAGALRVLSVIPPMTQLNTPYPSTAYLTGFLRSRGVDAVQEDLALKLVLRLLSPAGLDDIRTRAEALPRKQRTPLVQGFLDHFTRYRYTIGPAIAFLQGRDPTIAHRIASRTFLPEGPRFDAVDAYVDPDDPEGGDPLFHHCNHRRPLCLRGTDRTLGLQQHVDQRVVVQPPQPFDDRAETRRQHGGDFAHTPIVDQGCDKTGRPNQGGG